MANLYNEEIYCYIDKEGNFIDEIDENNKDNEVITVHIDYNKTDSQEIKFKNEEIDSRVQARFFLRYPFQKEFHVLLEVQAWILHAEKVRLIFQDFCYPQFFLFPLVK